MLKSYNWGDNPDGTRYFVVCLVFQVATTIAVFLRWYSRRAMKQRLQMNDYAIFASLVLSIANMVVLGLSVTAGMGLHINTLPPENVVQFLKLQIAISVIWAWNLFTIKIAIVDIYMKIFRPEKVFMKICWAYLILQCCWVVAAMLQNLLWCIPIDFAWDKTIPGGRCGSLEKSYYSGHIIIFIQDFILAVMPIPVLWKLQMNTRKKIGISVMFAIGIVIGVFDLTRIVWRSKISSPDITYEYNILFCFTLLEAQLGTILACIPTMQPIFRRFLASDFIASLRSNLLSNKGTHDSSHYNSSMPSHGTIGSRGGFKFRMNKLGSDTDSITHLEEDNLRGSYAKNAVEVRTNPGPQTQQEGINVTSEWDVRR